MPDQTPATPRPSLTEIANRYGTDKGTVSPLPGWPAHNYTAVYEAHFEPLRDRPISILEIGLGVPGDHWEVRMAKGRNERGGASLRTWEEYFPSARIYGIDINPASHLDGGRIATFQANQGDAASLRAVLDRIPETHFDIIIDDGSHRPDHQQTTLGVCFPRLRPGAHYFIEDLLANGKGDRATGRMACDAVLSTRRLLRGWIETGEFETPHAIENAEELAPMIAEVALCVPKARRPPRGWRARIRRMFRDSPPQRASRGEQLAVIRKRET